MIRLRTATAADLPALAALFRQTVLQHGPRYYTVEQTHAWAAVALDSDRFRQFILEVTTYIAEDEGHLLGFAGIGQDGRIASLYVRYDQLGQGIGTALMKQVFAHAKRDRLPRLFSEASEFSIGLFQKLGFQQYDTEIVERYGVRFQRYLMEKITLEEGTEA